MKTIIAGSRDITDYDILCDVMTHYQYALDITEVVSGCAKGVDRLGERWAKDNSIPIKRFPADWIKHGRSAGPIRNRQMAEYADALIAIKRRKSKGTKNMIIQALDRDLIVCVRTII